MVFWNKVKGNNLVRSEKCSYSVYKINQKEKVDSTLMKICIWQKIVEQWFITLRIYRWAICFYSHLLIEFKNKIRQLLLPILLLGYNDLLHRHGTHFTVDKSCGTEIYKIPCILIFGNLFIMSIRKNMDNWTWVLNWQTHHSFFIWLL